MVRLKLLLETVQILLVMLLLQGVVTLGLHMNLGTIVHHQHYL
jgi:hypothetical protein